MIFVCIWITVQGKYLRAAQSSRAQLATALMAQLAQQSLEDGNILRLAYMADRTAKSDMISRVMVADMTGEIIVDSRHLAYGTKPDVVRRAMTSTNDEVQTDENHWVETSGIRAESGRVLGCIVLEFPTQALVRAQRHAWMVGVLVALLGVNYREYNRILRRLSFNITTGTFARRYKETSGGRGRRTYPGTGWS